MPTELLNISEHDYRNLANESFSSIKHLLGENGLTNFLHYKAKPFKGSTATLLGTSVHHYLQGNRHLVSFNELANIKKNKEAIEEFKKSFMEATNNEGIIVPKSFEPKIEAIMKNFNNNQQILDLLAKCEMEKAFVFNINGVDLKGRVDGYAEDYIVEIKTSSQATTQQEFQEEAYDRDYDMQSYFYTVGSDRLIHYFIVANTTEPFNVALYKSSKKFLESGKKKAYEATERYKKYIINKEEWNVPKEIPEI